MAKQGTGRKISVRLYMEGRYVANGLATYVVRSGKDAPATAQLELVPTNTIKHILPGTWVHLFTTDPLDVNPAGDLSDFKLLFEGVVVARGFNRTNDGRNLVVQCADPSIYWTNAKQFWLNVASADGGLVDQLAVQTSGGYGRFGQVASTGTYGYMASKLAFADKDQPEERFMDTLISVLDDIGNVNPFYTNARNRLRITDRIIRGPAGKTEKLFQLALLGDFLEGLAGRVSGQSNLVDVVNQLLSAILHEWVSVPAPPYVKARVFDRDVFGNVRRTKKRVAGRGPRGRDTVNLFEVQTAEDTIIGNFIFKPHAYTIAPPTCNVLFPNMYEQQGHQEHFLAETTRLSMKPQLPLAGPTATMGLLLQRPTELEVFTALVRDSRRGGAGMRSPDARFGDGSGQVPTFTDYDWTTNEERIRGIVYNFMNLAPAPSTLTLSDPGRRTPQGARKGGIPKYLQNVASYEWYKSKFAARQNQISGVYNMRAVPGFPMLVLDDSAANMTMIANLDAIEHHGSASGNANTIYHVSHSRLVDEVDLNRPRFQGGQTAEGDLNLDLFRDEQGNYDFARLFEGHNHPPIPEWFDSSWRNVVDLDLKYRSWFGENAGVVQNVLFKNPDSNKPDAAALETASAVMASGGALAGAPTVGAAVRAAGDAAAVDEFEEILEENENITLQEVTTELVARYRRARASGKEFEEAGQFTDRSFVRIDQAFKFVGASPLELADAAGPGAVTFARNPAQTRKVDYRTARFDFFVGDVSSGSGYAGVPEGTAVAQPTSTSTQNVGGEVPDAISGADLAAPPNRMSGAFPVFDTIIHTGLEATDAKTRNAIAAGPERVASDRARYDGRPVMYDFEFRLWQQSLRDSGLAPTGEKLDENTLSSDYYVEDARGNVVRPKTAEEKAQSVQRRQEALAAQRKREEALKARGRAGPKSKSKSIPAKEQAPTGDGLEQEQKLPLPQPLSEKQVVDLRRAIIDAWRDELARSRGHTG